MEERRKEERIEIDGAVTVEDEDYKEKLGTLADLSPQGFRISGEEPVDVYDEMRLRLCLPERIFGKNTIHFAAICMWSKPDEKTSLWLSGFKFSHISQEDSNLILGLILQNKKQGT